MSKVDEPNDDNIPDGQGILIRFSHPSFPGIMKALCRGILEVSMSSGSPHQALYIIRKPFVLGYHESHFRRSEGKEKGSLDWIVVRLGGYDKRVSAGEDAFLCVAAVCCGAGSTGIVADGCKSLYHCMLDLEMRVEVALSKIR